MNKKISTKKEEEKYISLWTSIPPHLDEIVGRIGKQRLWTRPQVARYIISNALESLKQLDMKQDDVIGQIVLSPTFCEFEKR